MSSHVTVEVTDLVKVFPKPGGGELRAVDGVSFQVHEGEIFGFLGPNGAGKTTTLEIVEGLQKATSGSVRVLGIDMLAAPEKAKRHIGVQLQASSYFKLLRLDEILELFGNMYGTKPDTGALLEMVELEDKRRALVKELSGGQSQRFSIAAAMVNDPKVLFLDEPTSGLDPQARGNLWEVVGRIRRDGKTVVVTTHYMEEAEAFCDRVAIIDEGRIRALDTPTTLIAHHASNETQRQRKVVTGLLEDVFLQLTGKELRD